MTTLASYSNNHPWQQ